MKFLQTFKLFEAAMPSTAPKVYYHGTSSQEFGEKILEEKILKPGNVDVKRGNKLTPMMGMTYATPDIRTACIYALGGIWMEHKIDLTKEKGNRLGGPGQFGYVFEIDPSEFKDIQPDEDFVGELIYFLEKKPDYYNEPMWNNTRKWVKDNPYDADRFLSFARNTLTVLQYKKCVRYDDYADFAVAGKKLNKSMGAAMATQLAALGCPVANKGPLKISGVWKVDKEKSIDIKDDGSNFFEIAEKINV